MADVYEQNRRFREDLLAREYKAVRNILRAYERAWKRIRRNLDLLTTKIERAIAAGAEITPAWFYQEARFRGLLDEINDRYQQLAKECYEFTNAVSTVTVSLGAKHARAMGKTVVGEFAGLHANAVENIVGLLSRGPVRALFLNLGPLALRSATLLVDAVVAGENPRKAGRRLAQAIEELTKKRAVLIARTEIIRGYRMASQQTYQLNSDVLVGWRWTAAKTRATCAVCLALDGEIFPVSETLSSHPACRCSMVPVSRLKLGAAELQTGEEWFKSLPAFAQNRIFGSAKKGALYRAGGFALKDAVRSKYNAVWGKTWEPVPMKELREKQRSGLLRSLTKDPEPLSGYRPPDRPELASPLDPGSWLERLRRRGIFRKR